MATKNTIADVEVAEVEGKLEEVRDELRGLIQKNSLELKWMNPRLLQANVRNWKRHPSVQREALSDLLDEVGWVGAMLWNELTGNLLDGHMRLQEALERSTEEVPVLVVKLTPEQENAVLALLDTVGSMYQVRNNAMHDLANIVDVRSELLSAILAQEDVSDEGVDDDDDYEGPVPLPAGGVSLVIGERYDYVVVMFRSNVDFVAAEDLFELKDVKCAFNSGIGVGRVVDGRWFMDKVQAIRSGESR